MFDDIQSSWYPKHPLSNGCFSWMILKLGKWLFHQTSIKKWLFTLPETNGSHLKMDGWTASFLLGPGPFSGAFAVSFRECRVPRCQSCLYFTELGSHWELGSTTGPP